MATGFQQAQCAIHGICSTAQVKAAHVPYAVPLHLPHTRAELHGACLNFDRAVGAGITEDAPQPGTVQYMVQAALSACAPSTTAVQAVEARVQCLADGLAAMQQSEALPARPDPAPAPAAIFNIGQLVLPSSSAPPDLMDMLAGGVGQVTDISEPDESGQRQLHVTRVGAEVSLRVTARETQQPVVAALPPAKEYSWPHSLEAWREEHGEAAKELAGAVACDGWGESASAAALLELALGCLRVVVSPTAASGELREAAASCAERAAAHLLLLARSGLCQSTAQSLHQAVRCFVAWVAAVCCMAPALVKLCTSDSVPGYSALVRLLPGAGLGGALLLASDRPSAVEAGGAVKSRSRAPSVDVAGGPEAGSAAGAGGAAAAAGAGASTRGSNGSSSKYSNAASGESLSAAIAAMLTPWMPRVLKAAASALHTCPSLHNEAVDAVQSDAAWTRAMPGLQTVLISASGLVSAASDSPDVAALCSQAGGAAAGLPTDQPGCRAALMSSCAARLLDVLQIWTVLAGRSAGTLVIGLPEQYTERQCEPWLDSVILSGGLQDRASAELRAVCCKALPAASTLRATRRSAGSAASVGSPKLSAAMPPPAHSTPAAEAPAVPAPPSTLLQALSNPSSVGSNAGTAGSASRAGASAPSASDASQAHTYRAMLERSRAQELRLQDALRSGSTAQLAEAGLALCDPGLELAKAALAVAPGFALEPGSVAALVSKCVVAGDGLSADILQALWDNVAAPASLAVARALHTPCTSPASAVSPSLAAPPLLTLGSSATGSATSAHHAKHCTDLQPLLDASADQLHVLPSFGIAATHWLDAHCAPKLTGMKARRAARRGKEYNVPLDNVHASPFPDVEAAVLAALALHGAALEELARGACSWLAFAVQQSNGLAGLTFQAIQEHCPAPGAVLCEAYQSLCSVRGYLWDQVLLHRAGALKAALAVTVEGTSTGTTPALGPAASPGMRARSPAPTAIGTGAPAKQAATSSTQFTYQSSSGAPTPLMSAALDAGEAAAGLAKGGLAPLTLTSASAIQARRLPATTRRVVDVPRSAVDMAAQLRARAGALLLLTPASHCAAGPTPAALAAEHSGLDSVGPPDTPSEGRANSARSLSSVHWGSGVAGSMPAWPVCSRAIASYLRWGQLAPPRVLLPLLHVRNVRAQHRALGLGSWHDCLGQLLAWGGMPADCVHDSAGDAGDATERGYLLRRAVRDLMFPLRRCFVGRATPDTAAPASGESSVHGATSLLSPLEQATTVRAHWLVQLAGAQQDTLAAVQTEFRQLFSGLHRVMHCAAELCDAATLAELAHAWVLDWSDMDAEFLMHTAVLTTLGSVQQDSGQFAAAQELRRAGKVPAFGGWDMVPAAARAAAAQSAAQHQAASTVLSSAGCDVPEVPPPSVEHWHALDLETIQVAMMAGAFEPSTLDQNIMAFERSELGVSLGLFLLTAQSAPAATSAVRALNDSGTRPAGVLARIKLESPVTQWWLSNQAWNLQPAREGDAALGRYTEFLSALQAAEHAATEAARSSSLESVALQASPAEAAEPRSAGADSSEADKPMTWCLDTDSCLALQHRAHDASRAVRAAVSSALLGSQRATHGGLSGGLPAAYADINVAILQEAPAGSAAHVVLHSTQAGSWAAGHAAAFLLSVGESPGTAQFVASARENVLRVLHNELLNALQRLARVNRAASSSSATPSDWEDAEAAASRCIGITLQHFGLAAMRTWAAAEPQLQLAWLALLHGSRRVQRMALIWLRRVLPMVAARAADAALEAAMHTMPWHGVRAAPTTVQLLMWLASASAAAGLAHQNSAAAALLSCTQGGHAMAAVSLPPRACLVDNQASPSIGVFVDIALSLGHAVLSLEAQAISVLRVLARAASQSSDAPGSSPAFAVVREYSNSGRSTARSAGSQTMADEWQASVLGALSAGMAPGAPLTATLASLHVLGGFTDVLRVGVKAVSAEFWLAKSAAATNSSTSTARYAATVVEYERGASNAQVVFPDSSNGPALSPSGSQRTVPAALLTPLDEARLPPSTILQVLLGTSWRVALQQVAAAGHRTLGALAAAVCAAVPMDSLHTLTRVLVAAGQQQVTPAVQYREDGAEPTAAEQQHGAAGREWQAPLASVASPGNLTGPPELLLLLGDRAARLLDQVLSEEGQLAPIATALVCDSVVARETGTPSCAQALLAWAQSPMPQHMLMTPRHTVARSNLSREAALLAAWTGMVPGMPRAVQQRDGQDDGAGAQRLMREMKATELAGMGFEYELALKGLELKADNVELTVEWFLSGEAEAFRASGGLEEAQNAGPTGVDDERMEAAKMLSMTASKPTKLCLRALELTQGNANAALNWLLDAGDRYLPGMSLGNPDTSDVVQLPWEQHADTQLGAEDDTAIVEGLGLNEEGDEVEMPTETAPHLDLEALEAADTGGEDYRDAMSVGTDEEDEDEEQEMDEDEDDEEGSEHNRELHEELLDVLEFAQTHGNSSMLASDLQEMLSHLDSDDSRLPEGLTASLLSRLLGGSGAGTGSAAQAAATGRGDGDLFPGGAQRPSAPRPGGRSAAPAAAGLSSTDGTPQEEDDGTSDEESSMSGEDSDEVEPATSLRELRERREREERQRELASQEARELQRLTEQQRTEQMRQAAQAAIGAQATGARPAERRRTGVAAAAAQRQTPGRRFGAPPSGTSMPAALAAMLGVSQAAARAEPARRMPRPAHQRTPGPHASAGAGAATPAASEAPAGIEDGRVTQIHPPPAMSGEPEVTLAPAQVSQPVLRPGMLVLLVPQQAMHVVPAPNGATTDSVARATAVVEGKAPGAQWRTTLPVALVLGTSSTCAGVPRQHVRVMLRSQPSSVPRVADVPESDVRCIAAWFGTPVPAPSEVGAPSSSAPLDAMRAVTRADLYSGVAINARRALVNLLLRVSACLNGALSACAALDQPAALGALLLPSKALLCITKLCAATEDVFGVHGPGEVGVQSGAVFPPGAGLVTARGGGLALPRGAPCIGAWQLLLMQRLQEGTQASTELARGLIHEAATQIQAATTPTSDEGASVAVRESLHPHVHHCEVMEDITFPGARALWVSFDPRCQTPSNTSLLFSTMESGADGQRRRRQVVGLGGPPSAFRAFVVHGDTLSYAFRAGCQLSAAGWGYRMFVSPMRGLAWEHEAGAAGGDASLEWACYIIDFLLQHGLSDSTSADQRASVMSSLFNARLFAALTAYVRARGTPFKDRVVNLLARLLRQPLHFGPRAVPSLAPFQGISRAVFQHVSSLLSGRGRAAMASLPRATQRVVELLLFGRVAETVFVARAHTASTLPVCDAAAAAPLCEVADVEGLADAGSVQAALREAGHAVQGEGLVQLRQRMWARQVASAWERGITPIDDIDHTGRRTATEQDLMSAVLLASSIVEGYRVGEHAHGLGAITPVPPEILARAVLDAGLWPESDIAVPASVVLQAALSMTQFTPAMDDSIVQWATAITSPARRAAVERAARAGHADVPTSGAGSAQSALELNPAAAHLCVSAVADDAVAFPLLAPAKLPVHLLRLRLALLLLLNKSLALALPLMDVSGDGQQAASTAATAAATAGPAVDGSAGAADGRATAGSASANAQAGANSFPSICELLQQLTHAVCVEVKQGLLAAGIDSSWTFQEGSGFSITLNNRLAFAAAERAAANPAARSPLRSQCMFMQLYRALHRAALAQARNKARRSASNAAVTPEDVVRVLSAGMRARMDSRESLWKVAFDAESGLDWGGLFRDTLSRSIDDLCSEQLDLFIQAPNTRAGRGEHMDRWVPNPCHTSPDALSVYTFVGRLVGVALRHSIYLPFDFAPAVWAAMLPGNAEANAGTAASELAPHAASSAASSTAHGHAAAVVMSVSRDDGDDDDVPGTVKRARLTPIDKEGGTPSADARVAVPARQLWEATDVEASLLLARLETMSWAQFCEEHSVPGTCASPSDDPGSYAAADGTREPLWFTFPGSDGMMVELCPDGANRAVQSQSDLREYTALARAARANEYGAACAAMRTGLVSMVPSQSLQLLTWRELELLACGDPVVDIALLRSRTVYQGWDATSQGPQRFWRAFELLTDEERSKFIRFAWGRARLPRAEAFSRPFKLTRRGGGDSELPVAHSCFFNVEMPEYSTDELALQRLRIAVHFGSGGEFLIA